MWFICSTIFSVHKICLYFIICAFNSNNNRNDDNDNDHNGVDDDKDHNEAIA